MGHDLSKAECFTKFTIATTVRALKAEGAIEIGTRPGSSLG
jgi:hypothetical protein